MDLDQQTVAVMKGLVMDATRQADSGHPGGPFSAADLSYVLFKDFLRYDPDDATWYDRDRFILSAGHMSTLQYALLYLQGRLDMEDIKQFRQFGSRTPGHPEVGETPGVECTTGPLGQGVAMGVGMAAAEAHQRATLGEDICNHSTYVVASDGDLQEPVAFGAATLAGLWGLGKLIVLYDANQVQLAGPTSRAECADYQQVYEGICWHVQKIDGHDHEAVRKAIQNAQLRTDSPSLIICDTVMAKGAATLEGDFETHGAPLAPDEIKATKENLGLSGDAFFQCPEAVLEHFRANDDKRRADVAAWRKRLEAKLADAGFKETWEWQSKPARELTFDFHEFEPGKAVATRKAWGSCLEALCSQLPTLMGGSADLDPSNQTVKFRETVGTFTAEHPENRYLAFGVREFPMGAIANGLALHGGVVPFTATFLTFSDYMRNAVRMSALQKLRVLHVYTHDSFYLGEDGPTHQAIEHTASLRLIPNMLVMRPADANETKVCIETALHQEDRPTCLLLTRQGLPTIDPAEQPDVLDGPRLGGYILKNCDGPPEVVILATGSEVSLAMEAAERIQAKVRVVSLPCLELFEEQDEEYKRAVLGPRSALRVAVEAGRPEPWYKYVGLDGLVLGIDHYGHSAPSKVLAEKYGFTADNLVSLIQARLERA
ncbi:transketolase [Desulfohalovibrio reitneri]|uniref:transketolase n=1 Tax=Desulfohalovibrio reitneri TaxID=1307759 RepID=UPI0004A6C100|nr:transketolase [Desulfohalovibrio reitneri]